MFRFALYFCWTLKKIMYSSSDFEKLWFLYKTEGESKGISINTFCLRQGIPYRDFNSWFVKTRKKIVPVQFVLSRL